METEPLVIRALRGSEDVAACALGEEPVTIGRWSDASLRLDADDVLPVEVVLDPDGPGRLRLVALGAQGCEVNGRRTRRAWVRGGDTIGVGPFVVRVCGPESSQASPLVVEVAASSGAEQPLRATLLWRGTLLDVREVRPGKALSLGGRGATFDVPVEGGAGVPVVACLDGRWHVALDAGCRAFDASGDAPRPLLCAHPRTDGPVRGKKTKGGPWAPLPEGAVVELEAGDVVIRVERARPFAKERLARTPWWITNEGQASIIGLMFVCLILAMIRNPPPSPFTGVTGDRKADLRAPTPLPSAVVRLKETFKPIKKRGEPSKSAAKAMGKEGRAGRPDAQGQGRRTGPLSDEEVVKRSELFKALGAVDGATSRLLGGGALSAATSLGRLDGNEPGDGQGNLGLGLRGTGSGGGGLSSDSVGVGPVNTKGVGAVGSGLESGSASELGIDEPATVAGGLDREVIRRVILSHRAQIRYCYEKQLAQSPGLAGKLLVEFVIAADGRVTTARAAEDSMGDDAVGRCIVSRVKGWTFPKPKGGGVVVVTYPFLFKPAGRGAR